MSQSQLAMRLRSTGECVDMALLWLREDFHLFWKIGRLFWIGMIVLSLLGWWYDPWVGLGTLLFAGPAAQAPLLSVGAARAAGLEPDLSLGYATVNVLRLLLSQIITGMILLASLIIFPVAIWLLSQTTFSPEIILVEKTKGWNEMVRRLTDLSTRGGGRSLIARFWQAAILFWGGIAGEFIGQALVRDLFQSGEPFGNLLSGEITPYLLVGVWLSMPLWVLVRFVMYLDIRTRSESLDVFFSLWMAAGRPRE